MILVNYQRIHESYNKETEESMEFHFFINWINEISELSMNHASYNKETEESMEFHSLINWINEISEPFIDPWKL